MTHLARAFSGSIINRFTGSKILARVGQISVAFPQVINAVLVGEEAVRPVPVDRFVLQRANDSNWWVVGDPEGMFVIRFQEHDFNGTRKITYLKDTSSNALAEARVLREMPEWLQLYHSEVL